MYSPLHEKIATLTAKKKYAVISSYALKVYLPSFKLRLASSLIKRCTSTVSPELLIKIANVKSYHKAYANKVLEREMTNNELTYMAKYYLALKEFIAIKGIDLLLIHNDTRWYHAIAILICKEMEIKYLVTEQGLIRPNTTVIDKRGNNYNALLPDISTGNKDEKFKVKHPHDSVISMSFFLLFLIVFSIERAFSTQIKYLHNNYSLIKYAKRIFNIFKSKSKINGTTLPSNEVLLLLQLELDSQLLIHSTFKNNQEVINLVTKKCIESGLTLKIKKHPLDFNHYEAPIDCYVEGGVKALAQQSSLVVTVNSSAVLQVLATKVPLMLLGDSIYDLEGVAKKVDLKTITNFQSGIPITCPKKRNSFIKLIKNDYLLLGAGYSYDLDILDASLSRLLMDD